MTVVADVAESASLIACASAWTSAGRTRPGSTRPRPGVRLQVGRRARGEPTAKRGLRRASAPSSAAKSAAAAAGSSDGFRERRWSASAAGARRRRLDGVEAGRRRRARSRPRAGAARTRGRRRATPGPNDERVGVERHDDVGLRRSRSGSRRADRTRGARRRARGRGRPAPTGASAPSAARARSSPDLRGERRRRDGRRQDAEALAAERRGSSSRAPKLLGEGRPGPDLAELRDRLRAVGVVEGEDRRLREERPSRRGSPGGRGCPRSSWGGPCGSRRGGRSRSPQSVEAVAKKSGRPGTTSSGCFTYGTRPSRGCFAQAVEAARARARRPRARGSGGGSTPFVPLGGVTRELAAEPLRELGRRRRTPRGSARSDHRAPFGRSVFIGGTCCSS